MGKKKLPLRVKVTVGIMGAIFALIFLWHVFIPFLWG